MRSLSVTRTVTIASCHFRTISRAAARVSVCAVVGTGTTAKTAKATKSRFIEVSAFS
jgi:hypothetical protein